MIKNKKAVIRIIEAIIAVLILLGVVLALISRQSVKADVSGNIYKIEHQILNEVSANNALRTAVLTSDNKTVECFIQSRLEKFSLDFNISVCNPWEFCLCNAPINKEIFTDDAIISTNITEWNFNPKKIVFCAWSGKLTDRNCV